MNFTIDNPQSSDECASLLWGKSHYFDKDTRRYFRSRVCAAILLRPENERQENFTLLLTRETTGAGWDRSSGREHKVCVFNRAGNCREIYKGPSRRAAEKAYRCFADLLVTKAYGKR